MAKFEKIIVDVQAVSLSELIGITFPELFGISHLRKRSSTQESRSDQCARVPDIAERIRPDNSESITFIMQPISSVMNDKFIA